MHRILSLFAFFLFIVGQSYGQCSMCRAVVESNENNMAAGLNSGIVYLMAFPYLFLVVVGYLLFKKFKRDNVKFGVSKM